MPRFRVRRSRVHTRDTAAGLVAGTDRSTHWGALGGTICAILYGIARFGDGDTFVRTVDRMPRLFFDFAHYYYATADSFRIGENEAGGYLYSPLLAILLIPLTALGPAAAMALWAALQALAISWLVLRTATIGPSGYLGGFASAFLTLMSTATLHSFKWGQVGLILALLMIESIVALARRRDLLAAGLLGCGIALKFYPGILWPLGVVLGRVKSSAASLAVTLALMFLPSFPVLGVRRTRNFYRRLMQSLADNSAAAASDPNSQAVGAWLRRTFDWDAGVAVYLIGVALVISTLGLAWFAHRRVDGRGSFASTLVAGLALTCLVPFFVPTCWPLYFCTLPALTLLTIEQWRERPGGGIRTAAMLLLAVAAGAQIFPAVDLVGGWAAYTHEGWLLLANLATVACALGWLAISLTKSVGRSRA